MLTTQKQIRAEFWAQNPQFKRKGNSKQNQYNVTIRSAFVEFVDTLQRNNGISAKLAQKVTL
jgi:hypothetical protein